LSEVTDIKEFIKHQLGNEPNIERIVKMVEDKYYYPREAIRILINQVKNDNNQKTSFDKMS